MDIDMNENLRDNDTKRESEEFVDSLNSKTININDFTELQKEVVGTERMIITQEENNKFTIERIKEKIKDIESNDRFKTNEEQENITPKEYSDFLKKILQLYEDSFSWETLLKKMYKTVAIKQSELLHTMKNLQISQDVLREVKEMDKASREYLNETVKLVVTDSQDKFFKTIQLQSRENTIALKEALNIVSDVIRDISREHKNINKEEYQKKINEVPSKVNEEKNNLLIPKQEIKETFKFPEAKKRPIPETKTNSVMDDFNSDWDGD